MTFSVRPTSNTIVDIPDEAWNPGVGTYIPLQQSTVLSDLFIELMTNGRSGLFLNPVSSNIDLTATHANNLINVISDITNHLGPPEKANLLSQLVSNSALISFSSAISNTSVIEARYTIRGNISILDTFVANGSQTSFALSQDPQQSQTPKIFINGVYQSNTAYTFTPKVYGLVELLSLLKAHTDRLSGLTKADYAEDIDLEKIVSVGIALNTLSNGLDNTGQTNANNVIFCMSALFCSPILQTYRDTMTLTLTPAITSNTTNVVGTYTALANMVSGISNILNSDVDFYRQIEARLSYSTLAAFINTMHNEPSGKYLINYLIGTNRLRDIIDGN